MSTITSQVGGGDAVHVPAVPLLPAARLVLADVAVVEQGGELRVHHQHHVAAVAAVAAGRAAARDELLAPPGDGPGATVAGLHVDADLVDELHADLFKRRTPRTLEGPRRRGAAGRTARRAGR